MGLDFTILHRPDFAVLQVHLRAGQQVFAEPAAMMSMDTHVALSTGLKGGVLQSVGRALGGESLFINTFTAVGAPGEVNFAPGPMGDLLHYALQGGCLYLQRGSYVAHGPGVDISASWQGVRGFFSGEGAILLRASGTGDLFFNTYGGLVQIDVSDSYYVDTGYIVAFEETLSYEITTLPGLGLSSRFKTFLFGGEGLVCRFRGQGKLWVQTRAVNPFLGFIHPYRSIRRRKREDASES